MAINVVYAYVVFVIMICIVSAFPPCFIYVLLFLYVCLFIQYCSFVFFTVMYLPRWCAQVERPSGEPRWCAQVVRPGGAPICRLPATCEVEQSKVRSNAVTPKER